MIFYRASEHAEHYLTLKARLAEVRVALCRIYREGFLRDKRTGEPIRNPETGGIIYVKFYFTADKPFLCHALGRRSFNHHHFSPFCRCTLDEMYNTKHDALTHYENISFETRCSWALVPLWEALGLEEPEDWSVTDARGKVWSKKEVLAERKRIELLEEGPRTKALEEWSMNNHGQEFNRHPLLPYHDSGPDVLHLNINQWNSAAVEAFHEHLLLADDKEADPGLRAKAKEIRDLVNARLQESGTNLMLSFGIKGKGHSVNGPKLKKFMRNPTLLVDLIKLMEPLYDLMEIKTPKRVAMDETVARNLGVRLAPVATDAPAAVPGSELRSDGRGSGGGRGRGRGRKSKRGRGKGGGPIVPQYSSLAAQSAASSSQSALTPTQPTAEEEQAWAARPSYKQRVCTMFYALACFWQFLHQERGDVDAFPDGQAEELAKEAATIALDVENAMLACIGHKKQRGYAHDTLYGVSKIFLILKNAYLGSTEGFEHAHQEMKKMFRAMCSHSDKNKCDTLQFLNLHTLRRIATRELRDLAPDNAYTRRVMGEKKSDTGVKDTDAPVEETKANLAARGGEGAEGAPNFLSGELFPTLQQAYPKKVPPRYKSPTPTGNKRRAEESPAQPSPDRPSNEP